MELTRFIDAYCERAGPGYWAEPVNAVTNAAFLVAAFVMWRRCRGYDLPIAHLLILLLAAIGFGSYLFHTHAQVWASLADTTPIGLFILAYLFAANRDYWRMPLWAAVGATALFIPYARLTVPVFAALPFFSISAPYWPVPLLILIYAALLARRAPATARGLALGGAVLIVSLVFRSLDRPLCGAWPVGTHFLWHLLNALMLGWMIEVYRRHMAGPRAAQQPVAADRRGR